MSTKRTLGPLTLDYPDCWGEGVVRDASGRSVCTLDIRQSAFPPDDDEREAYGHLFAAAPELLALLQEVFCIGERLVDDVYGHEFVANAKAAIAKATGSDE